MHSEPVASEAGQGPPPPALVEEDAPVAQVPPTHAPEAQLAPTAQVSPSPSGGAQLPAVQLEVAHCASVVQLPPGATPGASPTQAPLSQIPEAQLAGPAHAAPAARLSSPACPMQVQPAPASAVTKASAKAIRVRRAGDRTMV